jgi:hypothetical protein
MSLKSWQNHVISRNLLLGMNGQQVVHFIVIGATVAFLYGILQMSIYDYDYLECLGVVMYYLALLP